MNQPFNQQSTNILFPLAITMKFDRIDQIRDWRLCLGCGACVAACPDKNLVLRDVSVRGLRPVLKSEDCQHCGRCVQVCPGIELKHPFSEKSILDEWGPIQELWEGYAEDPQLRFRGSSGGAATAIAFYCLKEASAAGVLHTGVHLSEPLRNIPVFSRTYEALLACAGSRYSPAGPCEKLEWIHNGAGRCVFIGKPCDVAALQKYQAVFPEIKEKVMAAISIFCAGTPSTEGTLRVLAKMGVSVGDVDAFRYRGYGWPGNATAVTKTGVQTHELTYQECWGDILSRYVPFRCRLCPDSTGEFADISCGDPWYRKDQSNEPGRSLVIIRTDRGRDIVRRAVESGYLVLEPVSSEVIALSQRSLLYKRRQMWARLKTLNLMGVPVPNYTGFDLYGSWKRLSVVEQFKSFAGTLRRAIRRKWYRPDSQEAIDRVDKKIFQKNNSAEKQQAIVSGGGVIKDVSVIIVSWNTRQILKNCLVSIYEQTAGISFEVFVVDNASSDGSAEMVRQLFSQVKLIVNSDNRGFAAANNQAIRQATGRYLLLLNSDTVILENAITKTALYAEKHPDAGIIGCRILNADQTVQPSCFMYPSVLNMFLLTTYLSRIFPRNRFFGRERMTWWDRSDERQVQVVTGCFMLVRRDMVEQIGFLDEDYFIYGEETDWCFRARQAGWKILFTPEAKIIHLGGASSQQVRPEMILQLRGSLLYFMKKNRSRISYWASCVLVSLFFSLRSPYWFLRGLFIKSDHVHSFQLAKTYAVGAVKTFGGVDSLRRKPVTRGLQQ